MQRPSVFRSAPSLLFAVAGIVACAEGSDGDATTSSTGGGVAWTTSSGTGGQGGTASQGGAGGGGSSASMGGAGTGGSSTSAGGEGGVGEGGSTRMGQAVVLAVGSGTVLAADFDPVAGWTAETFVASPSDRPAIALRAPNDAIGLLRDGGALAYVTFDGQWSAPADVGPAITTRSTPALVANAVQGFGVFHGDDFLHYFTAYTSSFNPEDEPVGNPTSFGPHPAAIALAGGAPIVVFTGSDGDLYDQTRTGGAWQTATAHGLTGAERTPAIVSLDQGPELLVVVNRTNTSISFTTRSGGAWSSVSDLPDALSQDPVSLAPMSGGRAIAAFRGTNGLVYTSVYDPAGAPVWSVPAPLEGGNAATPSTPSVATGIDGADAELVYVATGSGAVMHARLTNGTWTVPTIVGGSGMTAAAVASHP